MNKVTTSADFKNPSYYNKFSTKWAEMDKEAGLLRQVQVQSPARCFSWQEQKKKNAFTLDVSYGHLSEELSYWEIYTNLKKYPLHVDLK